MKQFTELELVQYLKDHGDSCINIIAYDNGLSVEQVEEIVQIARKNGALIVRDARGRYMLAHSRERYDQWKREYGTPILAAWLDALHGMDRAAREQFDDCEPGSDIIYLTG